MAEPLLSMRGIAKAFPGVVALAGVSIELARGEVLALVGENGAGKSTLMKILGGAQQPDAGEIRLAGAPARFAGVAAAKAAGVVLIHQELMLAPNLDIAGNIFLGCEPRRWGPLARLDREAMNAAAVKLLARLGLDVAPSTPVARLTTGQMQMVEIAKALAVDARIIIMDEPTSSLTQIETEKLFKVIADLKAAGIAIIYISHRFAEIMRIADRITVMKDGRHVGDLDAKTTTHDQIVSLMVGREFTTRFPARGGSAGDELLAVRDLVVPGARAGLSFSARRGEIVGFAGLVGAGRTELMRVLFGVDRPLGGTMTFAGAAYAPRGPSDAIRRGIYLAPEDRKLHGVVLPMAVDMNISLPAIASYRPRWLLQRGTERRIAAEQVAKLAIKASSLDHKVVNLSGGNQQKVVLGKWLAMDPKLLILDEPTRGIDVGAKAEIYRHIAALADNGIAVLLVSSELEELIGLSDRVIVLHERRLTGELPRAKLNEEDIMKLMTGESGAAA